MLPAAGGAGAGSAVALSRADEETNELSALQFARQHSELFKGHLKDDPTSDIESCFPPETVFARERTIVCLGMLQQLRAEISEDDPWRIFHVREGLFTSFRHKSSQDLTDMSQLANYLLMPKAFNQAVEQHEAGTRAHAAYTKAVEAYSFTTSFEPRPRLYDFVMADDVLKPMLLAALAAVDKLEGVFHLMKPRRTDEISPYDKYCYMTLARRAFLDGLMGEPLSEYGYTPSTKRVGAYYAASVLTGRPIDLARLPRSSECIARLYRYTGFDGGPNSFLGNPMDMAAVLGKVEVLEQLQTHGWLKPERPDKEGWPSVIRSAARHGRRNVIEWCIRAFPDNWGAVKACDTALQNGQFELGKWLFYEYNLLQPLLKLPHNEGRGLANYASAAAKRNDLDAVKWLISVPEAKLDKACTYGSVLSEACSHQNKEMLELAVAAGFRSDSSELSKLLFQERLDLYAIVKTSAGHSDDDWYLVGPACKGFKGDIEVLKYLVESGAKLSPESTGSLPFYAAMYGYVHVLEWLASQPGFENWATDPDARTFESVLFCAVHHSQVAVVEWLVGRAQSKLRHPERVRSFDFFLDCPWHEVPGPDTDVLSKLRPYYDLSPAYLAAAIKQDRGVARWLIANGVRMPEIDHNGSIMHLIELGKEGLPMLRCLVEDCGFPLSAYRGWLFDHDDFDYDRRFEDVKAPYACRAAALSGSIEMLQFVMERGCKVDSSVFLKAASFGHLQLLRWLEAHTSILWWPLTIVSAARKEGWDEVATWLIEHGAFPGTGKDDDSDDRGGFDDEGDEEDEEGEEYGGYGGYDDNSDEEA